MKAVTASRLAAEAEPEDEFVYDLSNVAVGKDRWKVTREESIWVVTGERVEGFARRSNFEDSAGQDRLRDILRKLGIIKKLEREGLEPGDTIAIAGKYLIW